jgi:hypothetical protein
MKRILPVILLGLLSCNFVHADILLPQLIVYFPFDNDANDFSGNGNNGLATNVDFRPGGTGMVGMFVKKSSVKITDNKTFDFSSVTGVSIALRVRQESRTNGYVVVKKSPAGNTVDEYALSLTEDGHVGCEFVENSSKRAGVISKSILDLDTWYDIILIWKRNGEISLYVDGELDTLITSSVASIQNTSFPLTIGDPDTLSSNSFVGSLEDIYIYNRALLADEITDFSIYHKPTRVDPNSMEEDCIIYPNPSRDEVYISTSLKFRNSEYRITGMDGKPVKTGWLSAENCRLSLGFLKPGLYNIQIDNGAEVISRKILME